MYNGARGNALVYFQNVTTFVEAANQHAASRGTIYIMSLYKVQEHLRPSVSTCWISDLFRTILSGPNTVKHKQIIKVALTW